MCFISFSNVVLIFEWVGWLTGWLAGWLTGWLAVTGWLFGRLAAWLADLFGELQRSFGWKAMEAP